MVSFLPHPHENEDPKVLKISTLAAVFRFLCLFDDEFLRFCVDERAKQKKMFAFIKYPHIYPELWGQDLIYFLALFMCVTHWLYIGAGPSQRDVAVIHIESACWLQEEKNPPDWQSEIKGRLKRLHSRSKSFSMDDVTLTHSSSFIQSMVWPTAHGSDDAAASPPHSRLHCGLLFAAGVKTVQAYPVNSRVVSRALWSLHLRQSHRENHRKSIRLVFVRQHFLIHHKQITKHGRIMHWALMTQSVDKLAATATVKSVS